VIPRDPLLRRAADALHPLTAPFRGWLLLLAASVAPATVGAGAFDGEYRGQLNGTPASLVLQSEGTRIEGLLQIEGGLPTLLQGEITGGSARGQVGNLSGTGTFVATPSNGALTLDLAEAGANGQPETTLRLQFRRDAAGAVAAPPAAPPANRARKAAPGEGRALDSRLVSLWRYSTSYVSGEFTAVSEEFMSLDADGSCWLGAGRAMAGDAATSGDSGRGARTPCEWRSADQVLYLRDPGGEWLSVGRYAVDDGEGVMLQYLPNGDRRLWYRQ
jgi:hypothetical protein